MKMRCPRCKRRAELTGRIRVRLMRWWCPPITFRVCDDCVAEVARRADDKVAQGTLRAVPREDDQ